MGSCSSISTASKQEVLKNESKSPHFRNTMMKNNIFGPKTDICCSKSRGSKLRRIKNSTTQKNELRRIKNSTTQSIKATRYEHIYRDINIYIDLKTKIHRHSGQGTRIAKWGGGFSGDCSASRARLHTRVERPTLPPERRGSGELESHEADNAVRCVGTAVAAAPARGAAGRAIPTGLSEPASQ